MNCEHKRRRFASQGSISSVVVKFKKSASAVARQWGRVTDLRTWTSKSRKSLSESAPIVHKRYSLAYPITQFPSRHGRHSEPVLSRPGSDTRLPDMKPAPLKREDSWRVGLMVSKAQRRFSTSGDKALTRRPSLSDFLRVAMSKRSDSDKRKMVRELKRQTLLNRVCIALLCAVLSNKRLKKRITLDVFLYQSLALGVVLE